MTLTIIIAIVAFLVITLILVGLLLFAKAKLTTSGDVTIDINGGEKVLIAESGGTLLSTLANNNVFLPSACGGGGYSNNGLMLFPPMALIIVGCIIWVHRSHNKDLQEK